MEQLNLFEAAGMDADTGLPPVTFTKQEIIELYKKILTEEYHIPRLEYFEVPAGEFLSYILSSK